MSIKAAIIEKNEGEEVEKKEYTNLIMDDMEITAISKEDCDFLEGFVETQFLSLNSTKLSSLQNMPGLEKLERLELCENTIGGKLDQENVGKTIAKLYPNLHTLKLSNNQIKEISEIEGLKDLVKLESLDLSENPLCAALGDDYQKQVRSVLSDTLEVLDGYNKKGDEVISDEDESDIEDEEGTEEEENEDDESAEDEQEGSGDDVEEEEQMESNQKNSEKPESHANEETGETALKRQRTEQDGAEPTTAAATETADANSNEVKA